MRLYTSFSSLFVIIPSLYYKCLLVIFSCMRVNYSIVVISIVFSFRLMTTAMVADTEEAMALLAMVDMARATEVVMEATEVVMEAMEAMVHTEVMVDTEAMVDTEVIVRATVLAMEATEMASAMVAMARDMEATVMLTDMVAMVRDTEATDMATAMVAMTKDMEDMATKIAYVFY